MTPMDKKHLRLVEVMNKNHKVRTRVTTESHYWFFHLYFAKYIRYRTAPFQKELFALSEKDDLQTLIVCAFRGSGKSTIFSTSLPLWAILGKPQKKFVLIFTQTIGQAKQLMANIRGELEENPLLKNDLGPFQEESDEWGYSSLVFARQDARITVASCEQSIRGRRHKQHRPDLVILDDVEDMDSARTHEGRQKTYHWFKRDVIPAGDLDTTRFIIIGNLLHEESLLMHLKRDLEENKIRGIFKMYPLLDEESVSLWPGKYPTPEKIEQQRMMVGNDIAWQREFLLHMVPEEDQAILPEWIQYYDELPLHGSIRKVLIGVDLAISEKDTADCTAAVSGVMSGRGKEFRLHILPNPINRRMDFVKTIEQLKVIYDVSKKIYPTVDMYVEDVAYQKAAIDMLKHEGYRVESVKVSSDKRSRLVSISALIQNGTILFPRKGAEDLIRQIVGLGVERYDDLVDAFTIIAHQAVKDSDKGGFGIVWFNNDGSASGWWNGKPYYSPPSFPY